MKRIDFSELPAADVEGVKKHRKDVSDLQGEVKHRPAGARMFMPPDPATYHHVDAYTRHVHFINTYVLNYVDAGAAEALQKQYAGYKTDSDIRREQHRFLWEARDEVGLTWEKRLAKRYYDKLYKEYAIADLSRYKDNKIALRWRTQQEVIDGKGQFVCGARKCSERSGLQSWEVNFGYTEHGEKRNALVKVRLCSACSAKLNYRTQRRKARQAKVAQAPIGKDVHEQKTQGRSEKMEEEKKEEGAENASEAEAGTNVWGKAREDKDDEQLQADAFDKYFDDLFL